jgi:hypothetical protein
LKAKLDAEGGGVVPAIGGVYDPDVELRLDRVKQVGAPWAEHHGAALDRG